MDCPACDGSGLLLGKIIVIDIVREDTGETIIVFEYVGKRGVDELED